MTVSILISNVGADAGPFNLYSDVDGFLSAFESNIPKSILEAGYGSNLVPNGTTSIKIQSVNKKCNNYVTVSLIPETNVSFYFSTNSTSDMWYLYDITNDGVDLLTWEITGDITPVTVVNDWPDFDFSLNTGIVDGEVYDARGVTYIDGEYSELTSLDVRNCEPLQQLYITGNDELSSLLVDGLTNITDIYAEIGQLTTLSVAGNTSLQNLYVSRHSLTSIDLSGTTALGDLVLFENQLTTIDLSENPNLYYLELMTNQLTTIDLSLNTNLTNVYLDSNLLTSLDVSVNTSLVDLSLSNNIGITSIDISNNPLITSLKISYCSIPSLDISGNPVLRQLYCHGNNMSTAATDSIFNQLVASGVTNGNLHIRDNKTPGLASWFTLNSRGWTINEYVT